MNGKGGFFVEESLISVIVPIYNVEMYLDRCIQSILNQTYKKIEVLLLDDASTDGSGNICDAWKERDSRIRVFHLEHGGVATARNLGVQEAKGQYILFVDSDDLIIPELLRIVYAEAMQFDADMIIFDIKNFWGLENGIELRRDKSATLVQKSDVLYIMYGKRADLVYMACNKLYKKAIFDGVSYPIGRIYEDNAVSHKLLENCQRVVLDDNQYYLRQLREDSITGASIKFSKKNLDILYGQKERCELYKDLDDKKLLVLIYAEYLHYLIHFYYESHIHLKNRDICINLYTEFLQIYSIAKQKVKFNKKKRMGYWAFKHMPGLTTKMMHLAKMGKKNG